MSETSIELRFFKKRSSHPLYHLPEWNPVGVWIAPNGWNGPVPVFYESFDTLDGLVLMEAREEADFDPTITGKVLISC